MNTNLSSHKNTIVGLLFAMQFCGWIEQVEASTVSGVTIYDVSSELTSLNYSFSHDRSAIHVVDGSGLGLEGPEQHSNNPDSRMWDANTFNPSLTNDPTDTNPFITFNLGSNYDVTSLRVWNYNSLDNFNGIPYTERGVKSVDILISKNGLDYTELGIFNFSQATGTSNYLGEIISLDVTTQFVRFNILNNYANDLTFGVGLSEVQFSGTLANIPEPSTMFLFGSGFFALFCGKRRTVA